MCFGATFLELFGQLTSVYLYLTALMVATLVWVGEILVMLEGMQITMITREAFDNILLKEASYSYNNYRMVSR